MARANLIGLLTIAVLAAACSDARQEPLPAGSTGRPPSNASPANPSPTAIEPLVGEWARTLRCDELVAAFEQAGLHAYIQDMVWGAFFWPQVPTIEEFTFDPRDPCKGAEPRLHSHFFTADGLFGSRDENGEQVDDGRWEIAREGRVVINDVTFRYHIEGDEVTFDPVMPDCIPCFAAAWGVVVASPGGEWERVG
jgi:hypothetical protein